MNLRKCTTYPIETKTQLLLLDKSALVLSTTQYPCSSRVHYINVEVEMSLDDPYRHLLSARLKANRISVATCVHGSSRQRNASPHSLSKKGTILLCVKTIASFFKVNFWLVRLKSVIQFLQHAR